MDSASVGVRDFARMIGKSHVWVIRLLERGQIPRNPDGTIPLKEAMEAYKSKLENPPPKGRPPKNGRKETMAKKKTEAKTKTKTKTKEEPQPANPLQGLSQSIDMSNAMSKAKLAEKTFQARLRELEYKLKSGELVEKVEVAQEASWLAEQVKAKLLAIPPRISSMCEGRVAREIEEIITDAINGALKELQKCKYIKDG